MKPVPFKYLELQWQRLYCSPWLLVRTCAMKQLN
jgi:hypothetical protein